MNEEKITINGIVYVRQDSITKMAPEIYNLKYVMCRTYSAGVFAGYLVSLNKKKAVLKYARRIWHWQGAASLSQLAQTGTSKPEKCKFPEIVSEVILTEVIGIIPITSQAKATIDKVPIWKVSIHR